MARVIRRGEDRWYRFHAPNKRRPVLVLTRDSAISYMGEVTVAPISTVVRDIPSEELLSSVEGMPRDCVVQLDHLQTVSKARLGALIMRLDEPKLTQVFGALRFALGFGDADT